jgi:hypothetical protein
MRGAGGWPGCRGWWQLVCGIGGAWCGCVVAAIVEGVGLILPRRERHLAAPHHECLRQAAQYVVGTLLGPA